MQSKRNRKKNKDTARRDKNRTNKALGHSLKYQHYFHMRWGTDKRTERRTDRRTRKADGWWNGCAMFSKSFRSNRSRSPSRSWLQLPTRSAWSACLSVSPSVCLSVHPACGILNFWTWPTAVRRLWGETRDRRLGTGDCRIGDRRTESEALDSVGLSENQFTSSLCPSTAAVNNQS